MIDNYYIDSSASISSDLLKYDVFVLAQVTHNDLVA